jgi:hypothetical protein
MLGDLACRFGCTRFERKSPGLQLVHTEATQASIIYIENRDEFLKALVFVNLMLSVFLSQQIIISQISAKRNAR